MGRGKTMQKVRFPMEYLRVTQGRGTGSHLGTKAIDFGGKDGGSDKLYAPCDMRVIRIRDESKTSGEMYCESTEKVLYRDGTVDYVNFTFIHDNVFNFKAGATIPQGTYFYDEGGMSGGNPSGLATHVHVEAGRGKFGTTWPQQTKTVYGTWHTNYNPVNLEDVFLLGPDVIIKDTGGYSWGKDIPVSTVGTPVERNTAVPQVEILVDDLRGRTRPEMGEAVIAGHVTKGIYNILDTRDMTGEASNGFYWYKLENNLWCAKNETWTAELPYMPPIDETDKDMIIAELQAQLNEKTAALARVEANLTDMIGKYNAAQASIGILQTTNFILKEKINQIAEICRKE